MNLSRPKLTSFKSNTVMTFFVVVSVYFLFGWLGLKLATINHFASPIWVPSGIGIGSLILFGRRMAPAVFLGALLTNVTVATTGTGLITVAVGNMLEALVGSELILWICRKTYLKNYFEFFAITLSALVASTVSATIGVSTLYFLNVVSSELYAYTWYTWWSGDAIGILLVLPLFMEVYLSRRETYDFSWPKLFAAVFLIVAMFIVTAMVFMHDYNQAFSWILSPFFILAGIKLGRLTSRTILILVSLAVVYFTAMGNSPFEHGSLNQNLIYVQCLLFSYAFAVLFVRPFESDFKVGPKFLLGNLIGWSCIFLLIYMATSSEREFMRNDLNRNVSMAMDSISKTKQSYEILMSSSEAVVKNSQHLTQADWDEFVKTVPVPNDHFGKIFGLGYIRPVKHKDIKKFEEEIRHKGHPHFKVKYFNPEYSEQFNDHFVTTYISPFKQNEPAAGLDIGSDKDRREAAWKARRLKETVSTEPLYHIQDKDHKIGFTILHPMWRDDNEFLGWISAPVISEDFFGHALEPYSTILRMRIDHKGQEIFKLDKSENSPLKDNTFHIRKDLSIFGTKYQIDFYPTSQFFGRSSGTLTALSLLMSLFMLFIAGFLLEQITFGQKAENLINERTKELEVSKVQLIHSSKMASLGEMASGMAHEINNPLTIIQGKISVIRVMLEDLEIDHPPLYEEILKIKQTADRIGKIVKGLRTFSRSSNQDPFEIVPLERIVNETLDLCSERFRASGINLKIDPIPAVALVCRPGQISQVLLNVFNNAHDAIERLDTKWIHLSYMLKGKDRILIFVTDSGSGIRPDVAEKIMEPFFTTKDVRRGTGLGLSIVKGIVENHGGHFWLDTDYPNTRFIIELKREESQLA